MKKIIIYTVAWGDYVEIFLNYVQPCLMHDILRLKEEGYDIELKQCGFHVEELPVYTQTGNNSADMIMKYLRPIIRHAIDEDAMVLMAAPDIIFGENTIYNMVKLAEGKEGMCIAVPHLRIGLKQYIENENNLAPTNQELVNMCFKYSHKAFITAFDNKAINASWAGISVRKIDENNYCLVNSMPTVHLAQFTEQDWQFWNTQICAGHWDRGWLAELYVRDRIRVVGGSDIAFAGELTWESKNIPPVKKHLLNNDTMHQESKEPLGEHNFAFGKFYYTLRR